MSDDRDIRDAPAGGEGDGDDKTLGAVTRPPLVVALVAQGIAALIVFGAGLGMDTAAGIKAPLMVSLGLQGAVAAYLSARFGLRLWWVPIQLALPPMVGLAVAWHVPGWVWGAAFLACALVYWNAARGVPLYLSNPRTKAALAALLPDADGFRFLDLGCGLAGPVLALARLRPDGRFEGIESAPVLFALAWLRTRLSGLSNVRLHYGDFRAIDLAPYDVVYAFLSPVPMPALLDKARLEMAPGSLFVSNTFDVPDRPPDEVVDVDDRRRTRLLLWRM